MQKHDKAMEDFFNNVIKKAWTWEKLTEEEKEKFCDMDVFKMIKGDDDTRTTWLSTIYSAYVYGLGFDGIAWRKEDREEIPLF